MARTGSAALPRAAAVAEGVRAQPPAETEQSYYGRPAVKPSLYGWMVALYIYLGGLAGAAQIVAVAVDLTAGGEGRAVVTTGRVLALAGAIAGGVLLILDLHTKRRFYNMLRIFRATSPMSIGTYILMAFGFFSLVALAAQVFGLGWLATAGGVLAALLGLGMTTYTAPLLAATSTPLWAATPRLLACRFASSAMATGAAALFLAGWLAGAAEISRALALLAALAAGAELFASVLSDWKLNSRGLEGPLRRRPWGPVHLLGVQLLGLAVPLALYAYALAGGKAAGAAAVVASLLILGGGLLMRGSLLQAGNQSARRPTDYFRFARPGNPQAASGDGAARPSAP